MQPFSLLVKPVGGACNLDCRYCFYKSHAGGRMSAAVLERALSSYAALPFAQKSVAFQGGEPLLYDELFDATATFPFSKSIQTNATLIDSNIAARLAEGGWLVGVSLDGPAPVHNVNRQNSFDDVVRGIGHLERFGADYNLLTVVSKTNVAQPAALYRFLRDNFKTRFHQYIECTGPDAMLAVTGEEWGRFLIGLYDEWSKHDAGKVFVRLFESIAAALATGRSAQCSFARDCRHYLVVEYDGSVYPCDFFVRDDLRLGNVMDNTWEELVESPVYAAFAAAKTNSLPAACRECEYIALCNGDCPRNRQRLCSGWKSFFKMLKS